MSSNAIARPQSPALGARLWRLTERSNILTIPLIVLIVIMSFLSDVFFTEANVYNILRATSVYIIIGVGQAFVMTSRNIDLSVGSMMALVMALVGSYLFDGGSVLLGMAMALAIGLGLGVVNGLLVTLLGVPALLATLGMLVTYRGAVNEYLYGTTVSRFPEAITFLGQGALGPVPVPVIIALSVALIGSLLYHFTRMGRYAVAIGGNEEAAMLAGINVRLWKTIFFGFQGLLVGVAALVFLGRLDAAHPTIGVGLELHVIGGVVLGGTLLFGGKGTMWGVVLGMVLIAVLNNGLILAGAGFFIQQIFLGILLVLAVAAQTARHKRQMGAGGG